MVPVGARGNPPIPKKWRFKFRTPFTTASAGTTRGGEVEGGGGGRARVRPGDARTPTAPIRGRTREGPDQHAPQDPQLDRRQEDEELLVRLHQERRADGPREEDEQDVVQDGVRRLQREQPAEALAPQSRQRGVRIRDHAWGQEGLDAPPFVPRQPEPPLVREEQGLVDGVVSDGEEGVDVGGAGGQHAEGVPRAEEAVHLRVHRPDEHLVLARDAGPGFGHDPGGVLLAGGRRNGRSA